MSHDRAEIEATIARYQEVRERMDRGDGQWSELAQFFTDDAVFIDPAWGKVEGIAGVTEFLDESMVGLEDWTFPIEWISIDGDHVVIKWIQRLPGQRADGSYYDSSGVSLLTYAGNGKFNREEDHLNMLHVYEVIAESGWTPGAGFNMPPEHPPRL